MKVLFLAVGFITSSFLNSLAQTTITIGPGFIGTQATSNAAPTHAVPYNSNDKSVHLQILYTKNELIQGGATGAALLDSIGWYVKSQISAPLSNYTIKMKNTSAVDVSNYDGNSLITVKNPANLNAAVDTGWYMIKLNTPFQWNGTSNLLIDVCWGINSTNSAAGTILHFSTGSTSERLFIKSNTTAMCAAAPASLASFKPYIKMKTKLPTELKENEVSDLKFFPNPTDGLVELQLNKSYASVLVAIKSISGQLCFSKEFKDADHIKFQFMADAGIYFMEIKTEKSTFNPLRILKL